MTTNAPLTDLHDIKPPVAIPNPWAWLAWTLGALLLAAALWALWRWGRRRRLKPAPAIIVPPHVRARDRLRRALDLIDDPRRFCIAVSDALRCYLEESLGLRAPERTTEEFFDELQLSPSLSAGQKETLLAFLGQCDLVKFARHLPARAELESLQRIALQLVEETTPSLAPVAPGTREPVTPGGETPRVTP